jgi:hypothetical protein
VRAPGKTAMFRRAPSDRPPLSRSRTRPRTGPRGLPGRIASALFLVCFLIQIAPVAWVVAPLAADEAIHPCGCTGLSCVCPHPASERAACHLPGDEVDDQVDGRAAFDTCDPPAWSAPPTVPGVEPGPVRLPGPVIAGTVVAASPHPARPAGDAPEPPPPRSPAVA